MWGISEIRFFIFFKLGSLQLLSRRFLGVCRVRKNCDWLIDLWDRSCLLQTPPTNVKSTFHKLFPQTSNGLIIYFTNSFHKHQTVHVFNKLFPQTSNEPIIYFTNSSHKYQTHVFHKLLPQTSNQSFTNSSHTQQTHHVLYFSNSFHI